MEHRRTSCNEGKDGGQDRFFFVKLTAYGLERGEYEEEQNLGLSNSIDVENAMPGMTKLRMLEIARKRART